MTYIGHIKKGVVVLDGDPELPEGTEVEIVLRHSASAEEVEEGPTLYERLKPIIGIAKGLPSDAARNVDHYLYGAPKK